MGINKIFFTCDASNWCTDAMLSYSPTWEATRPVTFDLVTLKAAQLNYPVHEKEMLAIIRALTKWHTDLLGSPIIIYTDHHTLENFDTQKDLSWHQACWQEFLAHYNHQIVYIKGEDNPVADALSGLPNSIDDLPPTPAVALLEVQTDPLLLDTILQGYKTNPFCDRLLHNDHNTLGVNVRQGLLYIGDCLIILHAGSLREDLFRLTHDNLSHFSFDKSYASLDESYYWPNMRQDLLEAYIPSCTECQWNKDTTSKPSGPLHPLPIPDQRGNSIGIDFIGPLLLNNGFDSIVTITDCLGSDICIAATHMDITAERFVAQFFDLWYCENSLPLNIVSDHDKIFVSKFWKALHVLTGIKLKMLLAYHPETDGSSKQSNKTI
jgi:hypothetical protein